MEALTIAAKLISGGIWGLFLLSDGAGAADGLISCLEDAEDVVEDVYHLMMHLIDDIKDGNLSSFGS
jgi:hypothetical protein